MVLRRDRTVDRREPAALGLAADRAEEARLADPGLTGQQQELPVPRLDVIEPAVGELEQVVAPDEERTTDGTRRAAHGTEVYDRVQAGHRSFDRCPPVLGWTRAVMAPIERPAATRKLMARGRPA